MNRITTEICVGATAPFSLLQVSDTHLPLADERDDERKLQTADRRQETFPTAEADFYEILRIVAEEKKTVVHTGDLIDFVSEKNLDMAREMTERIDLFMVAGNHEFSLYVGEVVEDAAYRAQSLDKVQAAFSNPIRFASRVMNGVNLVAIDNSYYLFEEWQLAALRAEVEKGLPILLFMHNPLYTEDYYEFSLAGKKKGTPAYLVAVPEEKMSDYSEKRFAQQRADAVTRETVEYIKSQPLIRGVFVGHIHRDFEAPLSPTAIQYATGMQTMREIKIR